MRIWFDTEFYENGYTIELISIGLVREDGATYYAESLTSQNIAVLSPWLKTNVLPHLRHEERSRRTMRQEIIEFAGEAPEFWAYYCSYDWVVLCQLFGTMMDLPKGWPMYCRDLKQEVDRLGATLPKQTGAEHDALADALWTKLAWESLHA